MLTLYGCTIAEEHHGYTQPGASMMRLLLIIVNRFFCELGQLSGHTAAMLSNGYLVYEMLQLVSQMGPRHSALPPAVRMSTVLQPCQPLELSDSRILAILTGT